MAYEKDHKKVHGEYVNFEDDPAIIKELEYVEQGKEEPFVYASKHTITADMILQEIGNKAVPADLSLEIKKELAAAKHFLKQAEKTDKDGLHIKSMEHEIKRIEKAYSGKIPVKGSKKKK